MESPQKKKQRNKWLALINIPIQMGIIVFLSAKLGQWLDYKFINKHNIYVKILTIVGVIIAFYNIARQLKEINKSEEEK
ncbi:AtpZ/AtpI family protein [Flavobacterium wongokense]|uniref:AtpZ/AtpI family protein n=1 Tax=Flavobacterium wongokense TaxID=2910674 RepID=UPI001F27E785|nr:AtpZ/AtpI family protein [Flavobacterium sp. WG47]MCF6131494.1 AtpZ/AtpI family protein [Flavobacterium sp. WG47]